MENQENIASIIGFGCLFFVFLALIITVITLSSKHRIQEKENKIRLIEKEKQLEVFMAATNAEETQKIKIASQLHDEIIPVLAHAGRNIYSEITKLENQGIKLPVLKEELKVFTVLQDNIREIIHDIVPILFTSFGLLKAIEVQVKQMKNEAGSVAEFRNDTSFTSELPFSINEQLIIFKICREILNNLLKHSNYDYLLVSLEEVQDDFVIIFSHDGKAISNQEIKELRESGLGMGLKLLESRRLMLNAEINYYNEQDVVYIKLKVPIENETNN